MPCTLRTRTITRATKRERPGATATISSGGSVECGYCDQARGGGGISAVAAGGGVGVIIIIIIITIIIRPIRKRSRRSK